MKIKRKSSVDTGVKLAIYANGCLIESKTQIFVLQIIAKNDELHITYILWICYKIKTRILKFKKHIQQ